jgi:hypothetical protein
MPLYELSETLDRPAALDALAAIPGELLKLVQATPAAKLAVRPSPDQWSAFDTLQHMRDCAMVYGARFRWILFNDDPFLPDYDENNWVAASRDTPADAVDMAEEFAAWRRDLVRMLRRLPDGAWQRTGRHEVLGTVVLEPYVRHQLEHERMHLDQIAAATRS